MNASSIKPTFQSARKSAQKLPKFPHLVKESTIEKACIAYLNSLPSCVQLKHGKDGWPDRIVCYRGLFIGIEIKPPNPARILTARQRIRGESIVASGGLFYTVRSLGQLKAIIAEVDQGVNAIYLSLKAVQEARRQQTDKGEGVTS